jgi:KDO2-lipid IV(A) lauroyltransferase
MKKLRYLLEAALVWVLFLIFRAMPASMASNTGGFIGRIIGSKLAASRKALKNIEASFPEKTPAEHQSILLGMWDNLGRVFAEYPHLKSIIDQAEVIGMENLDLIPADKTFVALSGHVGNWELAHFFMNYRTARPVTTIYRAPNNPYVEKLLERCRHGEGSGDYVPKSTAGTRSMVKTMLDEKPSMIFFDQKYNQGIPSDFFGRPAMTSTAFVQLARKFDCPILPVWIERINGVQFRVRIGEAFTVKDLTDEDALAHAHRILEEQIKRHPAQWLWLHRRWDSKILQ